jgi:hypothetical protein
MELQVGRDVPDHTLGELRLDRLEDDERVAGTNEELDVGTLVDQLQLSAIGYQLSEAERAPAAPVQNGIGWLL